ncbi:surface antigen-domain-containing protein [Pilobolus umbonatus]|nr:surface antigen-domain-containing protein [Pilobolus umbonatus]
MSSADTTTAATTVEAPLHVRSLRILGANITRNSFLNSITSNVFNAKTTEEVLAKVQRVAAQLQNHDIFDEIKIYVDTNRDIPDTVDVTLRLKEKEKGVHQTSIKVDDNKAELSGNIGIRNVLGGAETISTSFSFGNRTKAAVGAALDIPFRNSADSKLGIFINGGIRDHSQINAYNETSKMIGLRFKTKTTYGHHELAYGSTHRDVLALTPSSTTVRAQSGDNSKSSILHSFVRDERDNDILPTRGHYFGLFQELAGADGKGDVNFMKNEINASFHHSNLKHSEDSGVILSLSFRAGLFHSIENTEKGVPHLSDRFYLGGPLSVRGFKNGGIGERDNNDALGGEAYYAAGASVISTLPGLNHLPVKAHVFANAGSIVTSTRGVKVSDTIQRLADTPRTSVGFGLIFHPSIARIEANYCIPLRSYSTDIPEPKIQLGFGVNFL